MFFIVSELVRIESHGGMGAVDDKVDIIFVEERIINIHIWVHGVGVAIVEPWVHFELERLAVRSVGFGWREDGREN